MATRRGIHVLNAVLRSSRASPSLATSLLRPYPSLPRTLQPAQLARRYAHAIPKPGRPQAATPESESDAKPRKLLEPHYELTFTCVPCGSRSTHTVSKQGYHKGSVLITCQSCRNRHVISDHLNIFGDTKFTVEDLMKEKGQLVKRGTLGEDGDVEFWEDGTTTERGGAAAGKTDELKALDDGEEASYTREARDPSSPSAHPTAPSSSPLAGAGARPTLDSTSPNEAPSTRRQYHAAARDPSERTFIIPEHVVQTARSDTIGMANTALKGVHIDKTVAAKSGKAASASKARDELVLEQHELDYLRRSMRGIPERVRRQSHSKTYQPGTQKRENYHAQRAQETAEREARGLPNHWSTLSRIPVAEFEKTVAEFRKTLTKRLDGSKDPNLGTDISSKPHNPQSSSQKGDGNRWAASLSEMSTWIHDAVSNLEPLTTKLPVRSESGQPDLPYPEVGEAAGSKPQLEEDAGLQINYEGGKPKAPFRWPSNLTPRIGLGKKRLPVVPDGTHIRFVKAGLKFKAIRYIDKDDPKRPASMHLLPSPDKAVIQRADYNEVNAHGPHRRLSPSELHDTQTREVVPRKANAPWDENVPATMPSRLRKLVQEPKRFAYAWPEGSTVPVKVQVKPTDRVGSQEKARRYRLSSRPTEEEWEELSSNVPDEGDGDFVMSPELFKKELSAGPGEGPDGKG